MTKLPTFEEMTQEVAQRALDECEYEGKTLREWIEIIKTQPVLSTNLAEVGTDLISRAEAIDALKRKQDDGKGDLSRFYNTIIQHDIETIMTLPSAEPEHTCVNCGRTVNNGGWYADGRTRCPIEEHYALPKDGFCHLWEKRNVTDDDYPERRTDE